MKFSPENFLINDISRRNPSRHMNPLKPAEKMVFDQCKDAAQYQLQMSDFLDLYDEKEVGRDSAWVEEQKKTEDPKSERGALLESIVIEKAETADWLGDKTFLIPVTEYDDRKAHGDIVLEMESASGEIIRILLDVTASANEEKLHAKMERSFEILNREKRLSSIKYFQSEITGEKERLLNIPRVTIGITPLTLGELCVKLNMNPKKQGDNPIQLYFLDQMENQLIHLLEAAREINTLSPEIIKNLEKAEKEIKNILDQKESLRTNDFMAKANADLAYRVLSQ